MRAAFDSEANALSIELVERAEADDSDRVADQTIVALRDGEAVEIQVINPGEEVAEKLEPAAAKYHLDLQVLTAAAQSAIAVPDRQVELSVAARA